MLYDNSYAALLCTTPDRENINEFFEDALTANDEDINTLVFWCKGTIGGNDNNNISRPLYAAESRLKKKFGVNPYHSPNIIKNIVVICSHITPKGLEMIQPLSSQYSDLLPGRTLKIIEKQ